jgi:hypothetical protein
MAHIDVVICFKFVMCTQTHTHAHTDTLHKYSQTCPCGHLY